MADDELLRRDVRLLGDALGGVIRSLVGEEAFDLVEIVRQLARGRRDGDADCESELFRRMRNLTEDEIAVLIRAFSIFFDLANVAEDRHRARTLRERRLRKPDIPQAESIGAAIATLRDAGVSARDLMSLLHSLKIELVFTAHPTEAKRRTVREKVRDIRLCLADLDSELLPSEAKEVQARIEAAIVGLWQTDFLRPRRPTVLEEVNRGLSFAPTLWTVAPQIVSELRSAQETYYPDLTSPAPTFLTFGSWIGGDRDGHPFVTAEITERTLEWLRETAIHFHVNRFREIHAQLSQSENAGCIDSGIADAVEKALADWPELARVLEPISPKESYRRWLSVIGWRLNQSAPSTGNSNGYQSAKQLEQHLEVIARSLKSHGGEAVYNTGLSQWIDQVRTFGLHFARLDVRQESSYYTDVISEFLNRAGVTADFAGLSEADKQAILIKPLNGFPHVEGLSEEATQTAALFRMLVAKSISWGEEVIGGHVVSMTRAPSDILAVYWLWETAVNEAGPAVRPRLRVIPLFETIHDLKHAAETMRATLDVPVYADLVRHQGNEQIVMVGYSDSTKDGGYLAATWALFRAQSQLAEAVHQSNIRLVLFHGRGGALGRGGGPAARGIMSLPPESVQGALRMTEQGEVLAERYDDPAIAHRHLEQVTWATMLISALPSPPPPSEWTDAMESLSERAFAAYRRLVERPGFLEFFRTATPIDEIEQLGIGSRPSRRGSKSALSDLRAIPWVFAWTQNRLLIPAWYGLGSAITEFAKTNGWELLQQWYKEWRYFQATIDNAALALAKVDLAIAREYSQLIEDESSRNDIWVAVSTEYNRSRNAVTAVKQTSDLLADIPWFERSLKVRNPYVDPLNLMQVELFRRLRNQELSEPERDRMQQLLRLTIKGVAAGMRTTG